jgi:CheY-like chemotaxis protein
MTAYLKPDIVLMDWRMPVMDGLEATRQIMRLGLDVRVIICTAFDGPTIHDQAKAAGAFDTIAKGEHPSKLIELVRRAWRQ